MGPTDADLTARERRVAARESELSARGSWRRMWWALRLAPWGLVELLLASWCVVAGALLGDEALRLSCVACGVLITALACARLCGATRPPDDWGVR